MSIHFAHINFMTTNISDMHAQLNPNQFVDIRRWEKQKQNQNIENHSKGIGNGKCRPRIRFYHCRELVSWIVV